MWRRRDWNTACCVAAVLRAVYGAKGRVVDFLFLGEGRGIGLGLERPSTSSSSSSSSSSTRAEGEGVACIAGGFGGGTQALEWSTA